MTYAADNCNERLGAEDDAANCTTAHITFVNRHVDCVWKSSADSRVATNDVLKRVLSDASSLGIEPRYRCREGRLTREARHFSETRSYLRREVVRSRNQSGSQPNHSPERVHTLMAPTGANSNRKVAPDCLRGGRYLFRDQRDVGDAAPGLAVQEQSCRRRPEPMSFVHETTRKRRSWESNLTTPPRNRSITHGPLPDVR